MHSYYNSSYDTGKIPTPDAPTIEDIDAGSVYYCEDGDISKQENQQRLLVWHVDSKAELVGYSILTLGLDLATYVGAISGIIGGIAASPETLGAPVAISIAALETLTTAGIDLAYDTASIVHYRTQFEANGEVDVNMLGFVFPGFLVDLFDNNRRTELDE